MFETNLMHSDIRCVVRVGILDEFDSSGTATRISIIYDW